MSDHDLQCLASAYTTLLLLSHDGQSRLNLQSALAAVRDELARLTDNSPEVVQDAFEENQARILEGMSSWQS